MKTEIATKFKDVEAETIPEGWELLPLVEAVDFNPKRELKKGKQAKFVAMTDVQTFTKKIPTFSIRDFSGGSKFRNGDTLMARITPCLENGKTAFVDFLERDEVAGGSTEFIVLSGKDNVSNSDFVYYLSISPTIRNAAIRAMTGTSGRQRVENSKFANQPVQVPSITEQKQIAEVLSSLDDKVELNRTINKNLETLANSLFKKWFIDIGDELPKGWEIKPLDEVADFLNGLALQKYPAESEADYLPVIKIRELNNGITDTTDKASTKIPSEYILKNGDVVFSWSGSLDVAIWCSGRGALNQHLFKVTSDRYSKWFYYQWIRHFLPTFQGIASDKAVTMGHIKRGHLTESKVLVPDNQTLSKMDELMSPIIETVINNSVETQNLIGLRDSLLPRLMTGKIRVNI